MTRSRPSNAPPRLHRAKSGICVPALVDPPEGDAYGFPRRAPFLARLPEWPVENGYPEELIELYDAPRFTRILGEFVDDQPSP